METTGAHHCHLEVRVLLPLETATLGQSYQRRFPRRGEYSHRKLPEHDARVEEAEKESTELWTTSFTDPKRGDCEHHSDRNA